MSDDSMRAKARATFGKNFFENSKAQAPAKNEAVALQKRANARPIPTYKVGGPVKKEPVTGGSGSVPKTPERIEFEKQMLRQQKATGQTPAKKADGGDMKPMKPRETAVNTYGPTLSAGRVGGGMSPTYGGGQSQAMRGMNINRISAGGPRGVGLRVGIPLKKGGKVDNMDALKDALKSAGASGADQMKKDIATEMSSSPARLVARREEGAMARNEMADVEKGVAGLKGKAAAPKQSFGEAFKAARADAVKAGRDPDKEIFTWGGQKKVAKMAGSSPSRSAPKATAPKAKGDTAAAPAAPAAMAIKAPTAKAAAPAAAPKAAPKAASPGAQRFGRLVEALTPGTSESRAAALERTKQASSTAAQNRAMAAAAEAKAKAGRLAKLKAAADAPGASRFAKGQYESAMKSGSYADGGKVSPERIAARAASGMKKGGKAKPKGGLAVMIAIGKAKPAKAKGGKVHTSSDTARSLATEMGGMKCGGKPGKYAVGGAGKVRKGQAPIKKAQGGAAKVRKGMMSQSGDILQPVKPKKGIAGF